MTHRIQCWSGPRNISTALMYSFRQRADTTVVDEPLYTHFLEASGRQDPGREEILASRTTDLDELVRELVLGDCDTPVLYLKQIASHLTGVDPWFLTETDNVLLTREPADMLTSWAVNMPDATLADTGLPEQVRLLDDIVARGGDPIVVDSRTLLTDPPRILTRLCDRLGIPFDEAMLSWPAGPKPEDGVWAKHWYATAHRSTGFAAPRPSGPLTRQLEPVLAAAEPLYARLRTHALT